MPRIKFLTDYGQYKAGSEYEVSNIDTLKKHLAAGRIEVLKARTETATLTGENAMLKPEKTTKAKKPKK